MSARVCPCGCGGSLDGARKGAIWKDGDACRMRAIRRGVPATTIEAAKRAANANTTRTRRRGGPRGVALPYRRTLAAVAEALNTITPGRRVDEGEDPYVVAAEILEPCLSLTNRKRLSRLEQEYPEVTR